MKRQSFLKGSAILLGMVVITKFIGMMYKIPLTRLLGGYGMGYFSAAYSVFTPIFAAVVAGIPSTMARLSAENYALGRYKNLRRQRNIAHLIFGSMSLAAAVLTVLFSGQLAKYAVGESGAKYGLICAVPAMIFCAFMSVERGYFEGLQNMLPTAVSEIVETVFKLILGLGFAYAVRNYGLEQYKSTGVCFGAVCKSYEEFTAASMPYVAAAAILGSSLASLMACIYIFASTRIHGDGITKAMLAEDRSVDSLPVSAKILLKFAMPIAVISVITTITGMIDVITINPLISKALTENEGYFLDYLSSGIDKAALPNFLYGSYAGLAVTVFGLVPTITAMFGKSLLPALTHAYAKGDSDAVSENLTNMLWVTSVIAIPSGLGISVLSKPILQLLFNGRDLEIQAAAQPLSILGIAVIFMSLSLPCLTILQSLGKPSQTIVIMITGGAVKLGLNFLLVPIPSLGLNGAAIADVGAEMFICIMSMISIFKLGDTKCGLTELYFKPLYAGILCAITAYLFRIILDNQQVYNLNFRISLIFSITFGGIMYLFSLYLLCETPKNLLNQNFLRKMRKNP